MSTVHDLTEGHPHHTTRRADGPEASSGPEHALHSLQRDAGNAAVAAELQRDDDERSPVLGVVGRGSGKALPSSLQRDMEARIGADFSDVRVHDDVDARASAEAVGARAYTTGHEVVFGDGVDLSSHEGQKTLAHELTHVVQQRSGPVAGTVTGGGVSVSDPGDRFELEAAANADRVMNGGEPAVAAPATAAGPGAVQRQPETDEELDEEPKLQMEELDEEELDSRS